MPPFLDPFCVNGRQLPSLFLVGAQKCGTTSMGVALLSLGFRGAGHNRVDEAWLGGSCFTGDTCSGGFQDGGFSTEKEPHFFDEGWRVEHGFGFYKAAFPACNTRSFSPPSLDLTPGYMTLQTGAPGEFERLWPARLLPQTVVAMLLCDPVQRAQSYFYWLGMARKHGTFGDYVRKQRQQQGSISWAHEIWGKGRYGPSLARWLDVAGHVYIIPASTFYAEQATTVNAVIAAWQERSGKELAESDTFQVPSSDASSAPSPPRANHHAHPRLEDDVTGTADRAALSELFRESNEQVYGLIATDARVTVLPYGRASSRYDSRFLAPVWDHENVPVEGAG